MADQYPRKPSHSVAAQPLAREQRAAVEALSEEEEEVIAQRRADFLTLLPDAYPFFRDLYVNGDLDGWRSLLRVDLIDRDCVTTGVSAFPADSI